MFVGNTGTGKTAIMMNKLTRMDPEATMYTTINMNSFSDAPSLQVRFHVDLRHSYSADKECMNKPLSSVQRIAVQGWQPVHHACTLEAHPSSLLGYKCTYVSACCPRVYSVGHDGAATGEKERSAIWATWCSQVCRVISVSRVACSVG